MDKTKQTSIYVTMNKRENSIVKKFIGDYQKFSYPDNEKILKFHDWFFYDPDFVADSSEGYALFDEQLEFPVVIKRNDEGINIFVQKENKKNLEELLAIL